jgi:hypothetical protein
MNQLEPAGGQTGLKSLGSRSGCVPPLFGAESIKPTAGPLLKPELPEFRVPGKKIVRNQPERNEAASANFRPEPAVAVPSHYPGGAVVARNPPHALSLIRPGAGKGSSFFPHPFQNL